MVALERVRTGKLLPHPVLLNCAQVGVAGEDSLLVIFLLPVSGMGPSK